MADVSKFARPAGYLALAVASYLLYFLFGYVYEISLYLLYQQTGTYLDFDLADMLFDAILALAFAIIYFLLIRRKPADDQKASLELSLGKGIITAIILGIGVSGLSLLWLLFADTALSGIGFIKESLEMMQKVNASIKGGNLLFSALLTCIVGPIMEEILFRGLICGSLGKTTKIAWIPIFISALVFGIWHGIFVQGVYAFFMGLVTGYAYHKTRDLRWPIIIHVVNNTFSMLMLISGVTAAPLLDILAVVMVIPSAYILYRISSDRAFSEDEDHGAARLTQSAAPGNQ